MSKAIHSSIGKDRMTRAGRGFGYISSPVSHATLSFSKW